MSIQIYLPLEGDSNELHGLRVQYHTRGRSDEPEVIDRYVVLSGNVLGPDATGILERFSTDDYESVSVWEYFPLGAMSEGEGSLRTARVHVTSVISKGFSVPRLQCYILAETIEDSLDVLRRLRTGKTRGRGMKFTQFKNAHNAA